MDRKTVPFKLIIKFNIILLKILIEIFMEFIKSNSDLGKTM